MSAHDDLAEERFSKVSHRLVWATNPEEGDTDDAIRRRRRAMDKDFELLERSSGYDSRGGRANLRVVEDIA
jgi:hypothetical protein